MRRTPGLLFILFVSTLIAITRHYLSPLQGVNILHAFLLVNT